MNVSLLEHPRGLVPLAFLLAVATPALAGDTLIRVDARRPGPAISRHMTGVCLEDVNHEMYGGLYSQMIHGESFQEPPATSISGFTTHGGDWTASDGVLHAPAGDGPKLILDRPPIDSGQVSVQVRFADKTPGLAGLIIKAGDAATGADRFRGYEVSLDPGRQVLVLGRHRQNWEHLRDVPCEVPVGPWIDLTTRWTHDTLSVLVNGRPVVEYTDTDHPLPPGSIGLRTWQRVAEFRNLSLGDERLPLESVDPHGLGGVSGFWRPFTRGTATGSYALESDRPFHGSRSQAITFSQGDGSLGVENRGLDRWGLSFAAGQPYEGYLWMRAPSPVSVTVSAETAEGSGVLAKTSIPVDSTDWKRYDFSLTPSSDATAARFAVSLASPGTVVLGHAFLQPGPWGRFHGLPVRKDVGDALVSSGVTVMRLGGLMANAPEYRWKRMIGPRDHRPPYAGFWHPHTSYGWGIFEFLDFCEAASFLPIVDLNLDETPQDLADFLEYANGPADTPWGRRRAQDGHPEPYRLKYVEFGNEEAVDETYWQKFEPLARAAWSKDPDVVLIVGDFEYRQPITDPANFEGAPRIKSLDAHRKILDLAKSHGRTIWFDVHIWNHDPGDAPSRVAALATFDSALAKLCPGADYRICVLEENANNHAVRRALAHAETLHGLSRMADRVPVVCAANALQPDGHNDNGWDQGLVFLNPSFAWLQPPAHVSRMISRHLPSRVVESSLSGDAPGLDVLATLSDDGTSLVVQVVNVTDSPRVARLELSGFTPRNPSASVEILTGPLDATNTAAAPSTIVPTRRDEPVGTHTFPPRSFTVLEIQ